MDEQQKADIAALEVEQERIGKLKALHAEGGKVRFRVVAPLARMVTMTTEGRRLVDLPEGAIVPEDVPADAVGYHLRDKMIEPLTPNFQAFDESVLAEPAEVATGPAEAADGSTEAADEGDKPRRTTRAPRTASGS